MRQPLSPLCCNAMLALWVVECPQSLAAASLAPMRSISTEMGTNLLDPFDRPPTISRPEGKRKATSSTYGSTNFDECYVGCALGSQPMQY